MKIALLALLMGLCALAPRAQADCRGAEKALELLGEAMRQARDPLSDDDEAAAARKSQAVLREKLDKALAGCDLASQLKGHPVLSLYRDALAGAKKGSPEADALRQSYVTLEIGIRRLLPDDDLCLVATRKSGGSRGRHQCFRGQDGGATPKNLKRLATGWCVTRKAGPTGQQAGIEMNELAGLFEADGLPTGFVQKALEALARSSCPRTL